MYNIIIDNDINNYFPIMTLSKINIFEINFRKFTDKIYILIDDINLFYKSYKLLPKANVIFILSRNIFIKNDGDIRFKFKSYNMNRNYNFRDKIMRYNFIKEYVSAAK